MSAAPRVFVVSALAIVVLAVGAGCGSDGGDAESSGDEIAFTVNDTGWNEIWLMAPDGSERQRLTQVEPPENDAAGSMSPAWSPDGTQIAFSAQIGTREEDQRLTEIYLMHADGTDRRRLTTNGVLDASPSWSPDGERIDFTRITDVGTQSARSGIVVLELASGRETQVTRTAWPSFDLSPTWSPDGSEIAFTRAAPSAGSDNPHAALYLVAPDGSGLRKLVDDGVDADWSPDGRRIAYISYRDEHGRTCFHECSTSGEIYLLDVESGELERLTESKADDRSPAWSPDGRFIAFSSDRSNPEQHENEIYVMSASGDDARRITENDVWDLEPAFRP
jgi:TolB protein